MRRAGNERALVHRLAQAAHCFGQGKVGSGFDIASAIFGPVKYVRFSPRASSLSWYAPRVPRASHGTPLVPRASHGAFLVPRPRGLTSHNALLGCSELCTVYHMCALPVHSLAGRDLTWYAVPPWGSILIGMHSTAPMINNEEKA